MRRTYPTFCLTVCKVSSRVEQDCTCTQTCGPYFYSLFAEPGSAAEETSVAHWLLFGACGSQLCRQCIWLRSVPSMQPVAVLCLTAATGHILCHTSCHGDASVCGSIMAGSGKVHVTKIIKQFIFMMGQARGSRDTNPIEQYPLISKTEPHSG